MTTKSDFSTSEWETVLEGPPMAGLMVLTASRGGAVRETLAMAKAYNDARSQHGESQLLDEIIAENPRVQPGRYASPEELRNGGLHQLRDAASVLGEKATPEERDGYRRFVLDVASKVAEAHRENGEPVSPDERKAIKDITSALEMPSA